MKKISISELRTIKTEELKNGEFEVVKKDLQTEKEETIGVFTGSNIVKEAPAITKKRPELVTHEF